MYLWNEKLKCLHYYSKKKSCPVLRNTGFILFQKYLNPFCPQNYTDCVSWLGHTLKKSTTKLIKFRGTNTSQPACKPPRETLGFIMQAFIEWKSRNIFRRYWNIFFQKFIWLWESDYGVICMSFIYIWLWKKNNYTVL